MKMMFLVKFFIQQILIMNFLLLQKKILKYYILLMILYLQNVNALVLFIKN